MTKIEDAPAREPSCGRFDGMNRICGLPERHAVHNKQYTEMHDFVGMTAKERFAAWRERHGVPPGRCPNCASQSGACGWCTIGFCPMHYGHGVNDFFSECRICGWLRPQPTDRKFIMLVLRVTDRAEIGEELMWNVSRFDTVEFSIKCSDEFFWGCADAETITPENIGTLMRAIADVSAVSIYTFRATTLFCARVRGLRPQNRWFDYIADEPAVVELFKAAGPPREAGPGNAGSKKGVV